MAGGVGKISRILMDGGRSVGGGRKWRWVRRVVRRSKPFQSNGSRGAEGREVVYSRWSAVRRPRTPVDQLVKRLKKLVRRLCARSRKMGEERRSVKGMRWDYTFVTVTVVNGGEAEERRGIPERELFFVNPRRITAEQSVN